MSSTACSVLNISLRNKLRQKIRAKEASRRSTKFEERAYRSLTIAAGLRTKKSHKNHDVDFEHAKPQKQESMKPSALQDLAIIIHDSVQMLAHKHATMDTDLDKYSDDFSDILPCEANPPEESQNPSGLVNENIDETVDETLLWASATKLPQMSAAEDDGAASVLDSEITSLDQAKKVLDSVEEQTETGTDEHETMMQIEVEGKADSDMPGSYFEGNPEDEVSTACIEKEDEVPDETNIHDLIEHYFEGAVEEGETSQQQDSRVLNEGLVIDNLSEIPLAVECDSKRSLESFEAGDGDEKASTECENSVDSPALLNTDKKMHPIDPPADSTQIQCANDCENDGAGISNRLVADANASSWGKPFVQAQVDFVKSQLSSWLGSKSSENNSRDVTCGKALEGSSEMSQQASEMGSRRASVASHMSADSCFVRSESLGSLSPRRGKSGRGGKAQKHGGARGKRNRGKKSQDLRKSEENPGRGHDSKHKSRKRNPAPRTPTGQSSEKMPHDFHSKAKNRGHRKSKSTAAFQGSNKPKTTLVLSCMEDVFMGDNPLVTLYFRLSGGDGRAFTEKGSSSFWNSGGVGNFEEGFDVGKDWASGDAQEFAENGNSGSFFLY
ncbi:hypothetical protein BSKO_08391 [Bryopsis sp. KO-2023]|nr:hypothetical protein BSKO_08391 [Bryopsis sp. KO-2023]